MNKDSSARVEGKQVEDDLLAELKREFPSFCMVKKSESWFMFILDLLLILVSLGQFLDFTYSYTTTIGHTVYTPKFWNQLKWYQRVSILRHERVHLRQMTRYGWLKYTLVYLLWPIPLILAKGRTDLEKEAYEESMWAGYDYSGIAYFSTTNKKEYLSRFTGPSYLWMWIRKKDIDEWYEGVKKKILSYDRMQDLVNRDP